MSSEAHCDFCQPRTPPMSLYAVIVLFLATISLNLSYLRPYLRRNIDISWNTASKRTLPYFANKGGRLSRGVALAGSNSSGGAKRSRKKGDKTWRPLSNTWRVYNVEVLLEDDPGKNDLMLHEAIVSSLAKLLRLSQAEKEALNAFVDREKSCDNNEDTFSDYKLEIIRKSFDGRWKKKGQPSFVYTVDVTLPMDVVKRLRLSPSSGRLDDVQPGAARSDPTFSEAGVSQREAERERVIVVGAGPAGLFAAIELIKGGYKPIIVERGQAVEQRGLDIGALMGRRRILNPDSNLCFGEGGAGTWSDGKLTTRIGKNSEDVRQVLETLVAHGAPESILVAGKPHLGTDRLVRILKTLREKLVESGAQFYFGSTVTDVLVEDGHVQGVTVSPSAPSTRRRRPGATGSGEGAMEARAPHDMSGSDSGLAENTVMKAKRVVLAVGHSARLLYDRLLGHGVHIESKPIAVGFRVEHPQELINGIQYGEFGRLCDNGKGPVPVADYRLAVQVQAGSGKQDGTEKEKAAPDRERACYSFCMCPGGQIVPTSVNPDELCINGMSFSQRQSKWANSALVVGVSPEDMTVPVQKRGDRYEISTQYSNWETNNPLRGVFWQEFHERKAALMGGGDLVVPVQRATDFISGALSEPDADTGQFSSSYRMGVKSAPLHELYPAFVTEAVRESLVEFDKKMPGFLCHEAILHGIESRTSAPVQITRDRVTLECANLIGLYPAGEGAGYAGGIVSAAVDGLRVGRAVRGEYSTRNTASFDTY